MVLIPLLSVLIFALSSSAKTASAAALQSTPSAGPPILPNPALHPGVTNPNVTQDNIGSTICVPGSTKTIRPPATYTSELKREQLGNENLPGGPADYEEDHLIALELGGAPTDPRNLWPQPWEKKGSKLAAPGTGAQTKDLVEDYTKELVCSGQMSLADAQQAIASDWRSLRETEGRPGPEHVKDEGDRNSEDEEAKGGEKTKEMPETGGIPVVGDVALVALGGVLIMGGGLLWPAGSCVIAVINGKLVDGCR